MLQIAVASGTSAIAIVLRSQSFDRLDTWFQQLAKTRSGLQPVSEENGTFPSILRDYLDRLSIRVSPGRIVRHRVHVEQTGHCWSPTFQRMEFRCGISWLLARLAVNISVFLRHFFSLPQPMPVDWDSFTEQSVESAEVRLLGMTELPSVLALQKLMVHEVRQQSRVSAAILICEHPPSITIGKDSTILDLPTDPRELEARLLKTQRVRRDGGVFFHQPGQLAVYVVVSLAECGFGENEFRWRLQDAVISVCKDSQVVARRESTDHNAIWGRHGILCDIGLHCEQDVTSFGLFLNVSGRLDDARTLGRGLRGERISSMDAERVRPTFMPQVRSALIQNLCEQIGYPEYHIHTGHPFLKRVKQVTGDGEVCETEDGL